MGDRHGEVTTVDPSQERGSAPSELDAATPPDMLDEIHASAVPTQLEHTTEIVTVTHEEMGTLHQFLGRILPTPEAGFQATAPELARQPHKMIKQS